MGYESVKYMSKRAARLLVEPALCLFRKYSEVGLWIHNFYNRFYVCENNLQIIVIQLQFDLMFVF